MRINCHWHVALIVWAVTLWAIALPLWAADQPIAYSHRVHIDRGLQCLDCHIGADTLARAVARGVYEATAARGIVVDCNDLHCFRALVAWTLGALPGPSTLKWKVYAVASNAAARARTGFILDKDSGLEEATAR